MDKDFILKSNFIFTINASELVQKENSYLICKNGKVEGIYDEIPSNYKAYKVINREKCITIPGLIDLHLHASQYTYRATGMDLELLDWLEKYTFPEESKYEKSNYAEKVYDKFVEELKNGFTTRASIFATIHRKSTEVLMNKLEQSGLVSYVGKLNMDRYCPDFYREKTQESILETEKWIIETEKLINTKTIITPRFVPTCSDELLEGLSTLVKKYNIPVQSHLSENKSEIELVQKLCPWSKYYGEVYNHFNLFGKNVPTLMAHCVLCSDEEMNKIKENGVTMVHCPESNINVCSGIAPIRKYLNYGIKIGLGSDISGGSNTNMFRAIAYAIQVSKIQHTIVNRNDKPLTVSEGLYLATKGGGQFFGKVGSFEKNYEFDALVLDDSTLPFSSDYSLSERIEKLIYLGDERNVSDKFVKGRKIV